jgi:hypothetical protein
MGAFSAGQTLVENKASATAATAATRRAETEKFCAGSVVIEHFLIRTADLSRLLSVRNRISTPFYQLGTVELERSGEETIK